EDAVLCASEAVTNAIRHGGGMARLRAGVHQDRVRIEVEDRAGGVLAPRTAAPTSTSGRGLAIIETVASRWGTADVDGGKVVWIELGLDGATAPTDDERTRSPWAPGSPPLLWAAVVGAGAAAVATALVRT